MIGGTDSLFDNVNSKLAVKVEYTGGFAARIENIKLRVNGGNASLDFTGAKVEPDNSSIQAAGQQILGNLLKEVNLPIPIKIDGPLRFETDGANAPVLIIDVSVQVPGLEAFTSLLSEGGKSNAGKSPGITGTLKIKPAALKPGANLGSVISIEDSRGFKLELPAGTPIILGTTGAQYTFQGFEIKRANPSQPYNLGVDGLIEPAGASGSDVGLQVKIGAPLNAGGAIELSGQVLVLGEKVGDFTCKISDREVSGSLTFPSEKAASSAVLSRIYRGKFNFKLDQDALSADGLAAMFEVAKANFSLFLSLKGKDSQFTSKSQLNLDGFNAEASVRAALTQRYKKLHIEASLWVDVDLLLYKPTARVDITADCADTARLALPAPFAFDTLGVSASALGISVSWQQSNASLGSISLSDIEKRLRQQTDTMLSRLSAAAADWEAEKRDLLARWERHWSDTIYDQAKKYGVDKISTGNSDVDGLLGKIASSGKQAGAWMSAVSKGMGNEWNNARAGAGDAYNSIKNAVTGAVGISGIGRRPPIILTSLSTNTADETDPVAAILNDWRALAAATSTKSTTTGLYDLKAFANTLTSRVKDNAKLTKLTAELKKSFGASGYGARIEKAIANNDYSPPTEAEVRSAFNLIQLSDMWLPPDTTPVDPKADLPRLEDDLNHVSFLKERIDGTTLYQVQIAFGDATVSVDPQQVATVGFLIRIIALKQDDSGRITVTNIIPATITLRPTKFNGSSYIAEIAIPDVTQVNAKQFDWMKNNPPPDRATDKGKSTTSAGFDGGMPASPDDAHKLILRVLGVREADPTQVDGLDANKLSRLYAQSSIERVFSSGVSIVGSKFQFEKKIAVRNLTSDKLDVNIQARQRRIQNGAFQWVWTPSGPATNDSLRFEVPPGPNSVLDLKLDTSAEIDDFGAGAPALTASRIRLRALGTSGERWDYLNQDVFTIESDPRLGGERSYEGAIRDTFVFTIQSNLAPPITLATVYQSGPALIQHRGSAVREFMLPVRETDIGSLLETLSVERVFPPKKKGDPSTLKELEWEATVPSQFVGKANNATSSSVDSTTRSVRINLQPKSRPLPPIPGTLQPTEEIVLRYRNSSRAWQAGYRLTIDETTNRRDIFGWNLFENPTGMDWFQSEVRLVPGDSASGRGLPTTKGQSLPDVALQRGNARMTPQSPIPLDLKIAPFLVYDAQVDPKRPHKCLSVESPGSNSLKLTSGPLVVAENGEIRARLRFPDLSPGSSGLVTYPDIPDERVCIERLDIPPAITYKVCCVRNCCLEYTFLSRILYFAANYSREVASSAQGISFRLQGEPCWSSGEFRTTIGGVPPKQQIEVKQIADAGTVPGILDICCCPVSQLKAIKLDQGDPYQSLLAAAIFYRERGDLISLRSLLCLPDLSIGGVKVECCPLKNGMVLCMDVTVRNLGAGTAIFEQGQRILSVDGFEPVLASSRTVVGPCCSVTYHLEGKSQLGADKNVTITVDPDNVVSEFNEQNNSMVKTVSVKP